MESAADKKASREERILDAAAALIIRHGIDKTTMGDVAATAGVGRGVLYLHFNSKDRLLDALIDREVLVYAQRWYERIAADPGIDSIGGIYRGVAYAINDRPLLVAMMTRDRGVFGTYVRRPGSRFGAMHPTSFGVDVLRAMQAAGAVRADVDPEVVSYVMDLMSYGLASADAVTATVSAPPFAVVLATMADMLDRMLTPPGGGDSLASRAVILEMAGMIRHHLEQANQ